jgi:hypothetical protein
MERGVAAGPTTLGLAYMAAYSTGVHRYCHSTSTTATCDEVHTSTIQAEWTEHSMQLNLYKDVRVGQSAASESLPVIFAASGAS